MNISHEEVLEVTRIDYFFESHPILLYRDGKFTDQSSLLQTISNINNGNEQLPVIVVFDAIEDCNLGLRRKSRS